MYNQGPPLFWEQWFLSGLELIDWLASKARDTTVSLYTLQELQVYVVIYILRVFLVILLFMGSDLKTDLIASCFHKYFMNYNISPDLIKESLQVNFFFRIYIKICNYGLLYTRLNQNYYLSLF